MNILRTSVLHTNADSVNVDSRSTQTVTVLCGADIPFQDQSQQRLLLDYLWQLRQQSLNPDQAIQTICFTPAPYGAEALVESLANSSFAHHTLPGPAIPIPSGADFLGRHVSQVEADVYLPLPDANRIFQLKQAIRQLQRSGETLLLHAHTPGIIGYHVRREALKRRRKGKPVPLLATHWTEYRPFIQSRTIEIFKALQQNHSLTFHEFFTHGGLLERLAPSLQGAPEVLASLERAFVEFKQMIYHWQTLPNSSEFKASRRWGHLLIWLSNTFSRYSYHRWQGSLAAARCINEIGQVGGRMLGLPVTDFGQRPLVLTEHLFNALTDSVGSLVNRYLSSFYHDCDQVLNLEGKSGRQDLKGLGVPDRKIIDFDVKGADVGNSLSNVYDRVLHETVARSRPKRIPLSDFQWSEPVCGYENAAAHLAISDVHLGDGSGTERALATVALQTHVQRLGVQTIEIVGDLIQRDVPSDVTTRHRASFLSSLQHLTGAIESTDRAPLTLNVALETDWADSGKRMAELRRELQRFGIKVGARIEFDGASFGTPDSKADAILPVYIERGNHDEGEDLEKVIPGAVVAKSMIRLDNSSGVLFCHGNIWNLPEITGALQQAKCRAELEQQLCEQSLNASLETAQVIYSLTSAIWRACAKRIDVRRLWKDDLQPALSRFVQWLRENRQASDGSESEFSQFVTGVISPVDNAAIAAQAGMVVRGFGEFCWAVCDGHSHRPGIEFLKTRHPQTGQSGGTLLVNCGKFHGKNMTAVFLRFPEVVIGQWDDRDQCYYVLEHTRLSDEEQAMVLRNHGVDALPAKLVSTPPLMERTSGTRSARLLLEICTEGNGHRERQLALLPCYEQYGTVHVAASGDRSLAWAQEHWPGHRMVYDEEGCVRSASTIASYLRRQYTIRRKAKAVADKLHQYTHLITDFAPVLPMAMQVARSKSRKNLPPLYHVSHHAALHSRYQDTPRPADMDGLTYWATQRYLNSISGDVNIGFHFERYADDILPPPLAPEILASKATFDSNIVLVYLNGSPHFLAQQCAKIDPFGDHEWHLYSPQQLQVQQSEYSHIWLFPADQSYRQKLPDARCVITVSGFMGPAELIHLGKPFVVVPTPGHGEHAFNAAALKEISHVTVVTSLHEAADQQNIRQTLGSAKLLSQPLIRTGRMGPVGPYVDVREEVVKRIFGESPCCHTASEG